MSTDIPPAPENAEPAPEAATPTTQPQSYISVDKGFDELARRIEKLDSRHDKLLFTGLAAAAGLAILMITAAAWLWDHLSDHISAVADTTQRIDKEMVAVSGHLDGLGADVRTLATSMQGMQNSMQAMDAKVGRAADRIEDIAATLNANPPMGGPYRRRQR